MAFCTGRCMCHRDVRRSFEAADVTAMVERVFQDRVQFHDGDGEIAPGITVHHVGGHTAGLQFLRVKTARGWVVLAEFHIRLSPRRSGLALILRMTSWLGMAEAPFSSSPKMATGAGQ